jgi:hypothetical protein
MKLWNKLKSWFNQPPREFAQMHRVAKGNFRYVKRTLMIHDWTKPFFGDCDDFAATMCVAFPNESVFAYVKNKYNEYHVVCVYRGWVSDNEANEVYPASQINMLNMSFAWRYMPGIYVVKWGK